ncbi:PRTRC system protein A [Flagellatimonas centrodinii]|uniref:PRTRC system protein A n=1 Tax=Flagellatimonas centrodinii TaxID=2806210 RepID=UPI00344DFC47
MTDLVDRSLFETTPVIVTPSRSSVPELAVGGVRYLVTNDGLKIEARSRVLRVVMSLSSGIGLPYGEVANAVELTCGPIPTSLLKEASDAAISCSPDEWAGWIYWDRGQMRYRLWHADGPRVSASPGSIRYEPPIVDPLDVVFDLHSHGFGPAYFSSVDDRDDRQFPGPVVLTGVLGRCVAGRAPESCSRVVANGRLFPPWPSLSAISL